MTPSKQDVNVGLDHSYVARRIQGHAFGQSNKRLDYGVTTLTLGSWPRQEHGKVKGESAT
jgi:hypothetical protein